VVAAEKLPACKVRDDRGDNRRLAEKQIENDYLYGDRLEDVRAGKYHPCHRPRHMPACDAALCSAAPEESRRAGGILEQ